MFLSSIFHAVTANDNVLHLAELGRPHRWSTDRIRIFYADVRHIQTLQVWREAVTAGKYRFAYSERL
jgi:hypothetical protein